MQGQFVYPVTCPREGGSSPLLRDPTLSPSALAANGSDSASFVTAAQNQC